MKYLLVILLMANVLLAIEQVPRRTNSSETNKSEVRVEAKKSETNSDSRTNEARERTVVQKKEKERDRFIDNNSNGVNDRREDDFQNIKTKKSKHKEKLDKPEVKRAAPNQKERSSTPTREKTTSTEKAKEK
ncbi:MAG: hypothetical protein WBE28_08165 [bacterium]